MPHIRADEYLRRHRLRHVLRRNAVAILSHVVTFALGVFFGAGLTVADLIWRMQ